MIYLLDTSTWRELFHFYQDVFVTLWKNLDKMIEDGLIFSVDACYEELLKQVNFRDLKAYEWLIKNKEIFLPLEEKDAVCMGDLFQIEGGRFRGLQKEQERLENKPCVDGALIAKAKSKNYYVVTEETDRPNLVRIPSACKSFGVECCNLNDLMVSQGWKF